MTASAAGRHRLGSRSPIRGALVAGLTLLFVLSIGTGYELLRSLAEGQRRADETHAAFVRGEDTLTAIRTSVLLGSIYLRDALVDTSGSGPDYRVELRTFRRDIEQRVSTLEDDRDLAIARTELRPLRAALETYWDTLDLFLGPQAPTTFVSGTGVLRRQVVPARTNVLSVIDRLTDLQRNAERQREADAAVLYADMRRRFIRIGTVTLAVGIGVSWLVLVRVASLEREVDQRRVVEAQNRRDLERLSARLVDAQEQERRSLARELHDEVGQALTALKMELAIVLRSGTLDAASRPPLEEARGIAERILHGVRDLSQLLHPSVLDDFGLPEALESYVRSFSKRTGILANLELSGMESRLPSGVEVAVYRIVQEALTNVTRHSGATTCSVRLTCTQTTLRVVIEDDGRGAHAEGMTASAKGLGLIGMRERVQSLGGTFAFERRRGGGAMVSATVPLVHETRQHLSTAV